MKSKVLLVFVALVLLISTFVMAAEKNQDVEKSKEIAAVVNGEEISRSELDQYANIQQLLGQLFQMNPDFGQLLYSSEEGKALLDEYRKQKIDGLIEQKLLAMEAEDRDLTLSKEEKNEMFQQQLEQIKSRNNLTEEKLLASLKQQGINSMEDFKKIFWETNGSSALIGKLQEQELSNLNIDEAKVKDFYNNNKEQFKKSEQLKASHILIKTDERSEEEAKTKAEEILAELKEGAKFAELAKKYSEGPSAKNGGDLGFFSKGQMVPEFEEVAFGLKIGELSQPVKTQYGYHIIKVVDKKEAGLAPFEDVKEKIKSNLLQQEQQKIWQEFVKGLKDKAEIEIKIK